MTSPPPRKPRPRKKKQPRAFPKSTFLLFVGVGIILWEVAHGRSDIPFLVTGLVLCGFPVAEVADIFRNAVVRDWDESDEDEPEVDDA